MQLLSRLINSARTKVEKTVFKDLGETGIVGRIEEYDRQHIQVGWYSRRD